jgi:hypothetical protein
MNHDQLQNIAKAWSQLLGGSQLFGTILISRMHAYDENIEEKIYRQLYSKTVYSQIDAQDFSALFLYNKDICAFRSISSSHFNTQVGIIIKVKDTTNREYCVYICENLMSSELIEEINQKTQEAYLKSDYFLDNKKRILNIL